MGHSGWLKNKFLGWVAVAIVGLGFQVGAADVEQVLNKGNGTEPKGLDPHIVTGVPEHKIITNLFEGLVVVDPKTVEPIPGMAESWTTSKDGRVVTFKIRKNAKWSNGDPLTAQDFVYSWRRLLDPKTAAQYAYQAYYIKNGEAINTGKIKDFTKLGAKAIDKHTLQVTLENPTPFFLGLLYHYSLYPVHKKTIEKYGAKWTRPENIVSNGAFVLKKWELNKIIAVEKNPLYWDAKRVTLKRVNFHPVENTVTEESMFRAKKLDVTSTVPIEKIPLWQRDRTKVYYQTPYLGTYFYRVNVTKPPLNDKRVRKALSLTLDRNQIVKYVARGGQDPALAFTPPGTGGFDPTARLNKSVGQKEIAEAKRLLAEAGYPNGQGMAPIEILYNTNDGHKKIAEAIHQMWKKNLGIEVKLFNQEWKVYLASQRTLNYQIARAGWIGDYNDPNTFLDMFMTNNGNNQTGWSNKQYDKLLNQIATETDGSKRLALFNEVEEILMDELPVIPIYIYTRTYLKNKRVAGWYSNIMDYHPLKFVKILSPRELSAGD